MSVCEDSLVTDETIGTVQENLFKLKETAVNTLHLFEIFRRKIYQGCEQVWNGLEISRTIYKREQIKKLTIWLQVISEYSLMVQ